MIGKVLVVDDEPEFREVLVSYLTEHGYYVREAHDAETALRIAGSDPPDVVLLDIVMPGTNGLEALRRLRRDNPSLVVVMVSAVEDEALARSTPQAPSRRARLRGVTARSHAAQSRRPRSARTSAAEVAPAAGLGGKRTA